MRPNSSSRGCPTFLSLSLLSLPTVLSHSGLNNSLDLRSDRRKRSRCPSDPTLAPSLFALQISKMERKNRRGMSPSSATLLVLFSLACLSVSASASTFISGDVFGDQVSIGRNLLQAKKACPVNFEFLNYTIITGKCKGPRYPTNICCPALVEFACPYVDEINDLSNDCASTMFSYINLYGKYPPGLFANECQGDKNGLLCPASSPAESQNADGSHFIRSPPPLLVLTTGLVLLLLQLF